MPDCTASTLARMFSMLEIMSSTPEITFSIDFTILFTLDAEVSSPTALRQLTTLSLASTALSTALMKLDTTSCIAPAVELVFTCSYNALASLVQCVIFSSVVVPSVRAFCTGTLNLLRMPDGAHSIAPLPHSAAFFLTQVVKLPPHCPGMNGMLQA